MKSRKGPGGGQTFAGGSRSHRRVPPRSGLRYTGGTIRLETAGGRRENGEGGVRADCPGAIMTPFQKGMLRSLKVRRESPPADLGDARILAVQIAGMGDFLLAVPALRALRRGNPGSRLDLLTSGKGGRAAEGCPYLDDILSFDIQGFVEDGLRSPREWGTLLSLIRDVRARRYRLAVNLIGLYSPGGAVRMGLFLRALGIPRLAGRDTLGMGPFFHYAIVETLEMARNERDTNLELAGHLGGRDNRGGELEVWPSPEEERKAREIARDIPGDGPLIGVNPGTDRPEKFWPEESFLRVMRALREERGAWFLLTGGPSEAALTGRLAVALGEAARDTNGAISFQGTAALMRRMDLFLTCDTAALHLAWAADVPAVVLFKRENLWRYRPDSEKILCLAGEESGGGAPLGIAAEDVLQACRDRLDAEKSR